MLIGLIAIAILIIVLTTMAKYKLIYVANISGENVGYIVNKDEFEKQINDEIINQEKDNVAFIDIKEMPQYVLRLVDKNEDTNETEILNILKEQAIITYKFYGIVVDDEQKSIVNSLSEAEKLVAEIKEKYEDSIADLTIGIKELYTTDMKEYKTVTIAKAREHIESELDERAKTSVNGIYLACVPVSGVITSRFGSVESIRDHVHGGLDIGASTGTSIKAVADGTVTFSGVYGGYGNLVIISHGNGVETYYGHCNELYVSEGQSVEAGDTIAAVGSTGNSTGPHLHFEIRDNGVQLDPEDYIYGQ